MHLFYTPGITPQHTTWLLNEEESKHCARVLRLQTSDEIKLIDGAGGFYTAVIAEANVKRTALKIISVITDHGRRNHHLHIAVAPTKNMERLEWFAEKATEIGIDEISLIVTARCERREVKTDRLEKIVTSAMKQSLNAYHPKINPAIDFVKFMSGPFDGQKFIAHCAAGQKVSLKQQVQANGRYLILIGPEGDFTEKEIALALENGFKAITLGDSRLRTETAALEACFEINFLNR